MCVDGLRDHILESLVGGRLRRRGCSLGKREVRKVFDERNENWGKLTA